MAVTSPFLRRAYERLMSLNGVTLIHGDVHTGNVMSPRDPEHQTTKLIDWQLWDIGPGAHDLAFLMALHWPPKRRALLEGPLLERYHARLMRYVPGYSWREFFDDYRRAVVTMVLIPIGQFRRGMPNGVIWFGLQDATAAFEDLSCEELLKG